MKYTNTIPVLSSIVLLFAVLLLPQSARALTTAFTYQGQLTAGGSPANGSYDLRFTLFDALAGGNQLGNPLTNTAVSVSGGLFTVTLDFGATAFQGADRWLEIAGRTNGVGDFGTLTPRQQITPAAYAIFAASAGSATTASSATTANSVSGTFAGDVTGTQSATTVATVGGVSAANVASGATAANNATSANTPNTIVKRDGSGNFNAGAVGATSFSGSGAGLTSLNGANISSGTVGPSQLAANSVDNSKISSTAAIVPSKLANGTAGQVLLANGSGVITATTISGDATMSSAGALTLASGSVNSGKIADGTILDQDISGSASIAPSKLAIATAGQLLLANGSGVMTATTISGDATVSSAGVVTLSSTVSKLNANQTFTGVNTMNNVANTFSGASLGLGAAATLKLTVSGSGQFNNASAAALLLNNTIAAHGYEWHALDGGSFQLADFTASATRLLMDSSGNVGIGPSTTPAAKLDVQGNAMVRGFLTKRSTAITVTSGATLTPTSSYVQLSSSGPFTLSATTAIADGTTAGDTLVLHNINAISTITIPNAANTALAGATSLTLGPRDTLTLIWDGADWVETARSDN
jgi:hypothetical protein